MLEPRFWDRLDPRARVTIVTVVTLLAASTSSLAAFAWYLPLMLLLILTSRSASWSAIAQRCFGSAPFILLASVLLLFQYDLGPGGAPGGVEPAALVAAKGFSAALMLAFLTATTSLPQLLFALRRMGAPQTLNMVLHMMYRYSSLLSEEWERLERARESRTVRPLRGKDRFRAYGAQIGTLLLRSWARAERVHAAMVSRGFDGSWPMFDSPRFGWRDAAGILAAVAPFAVVFGKS